jgi:ribosome maturation factor RimP
MGKAEGLGLPEQVEAMIGPALQSMGYDVVRVLLMGGANAVLQIMVERTDGTAMSVDNCADISRTVSAILDVEDPVPGRYTLEVSSPGIDRPLVKEADFRRFAGHEAKVETKEPIAGRRRFKGRIEAVSDGIVSMTTEEGVLGLPFREIQKAKLIASGGPGDAKKGAHRRKG